MTSEERKECRYLRRKAKRLAKKQETCADYDNFDKVFSYENLYQSAKMCRRGVRWKNSTQQYSSNMCLNVYRVYKELQSGEFPSTTGNFYEFDVHERGKLRHIRSVHIRERVVQRCVCDYSLVPMLSRTYIYDNGASLKNKGISFSQKRLMTHLRRYMRQHGTEGYILLFDFSKFFDNISHSNIRNILEHNYTDQRLIELVVKLVDDFGSKGLGLGSQVSQILALAAANKLDHTIKEELGVEHYGRYMDDGYLIHESKEYLKHCLEVIQRVCDELGIVLNTKKTRIIKLTHQFTYLKIKILVTESGKIIKRISRDSITRMRRKLKKFHKKFLEGLMTLKDVQNSFESWRSHLIGTRSHTSVRNVKRLFNRLFMNMEVVPSV